MTKKKLQHFIPKRNLVSGSHIIIGVINSHMTSSEQGTERLAFSCILVSKSPTLFSEH